MEGEREKREREEKQEREKDLQNASGIVDDTTNPRQVHAELGGDCSHLFLSKLGHNFGIKSRKG